MGLRKGDVVMHWLDDIEGYRTFEVLHVIYERQYPRCLLQGIDTNATVWRILDNKLGGKSFGYTMIKRGE